MHTPTPKRVLVTGASGAVGHATCKLLTERGHRVAGTMRARHGKNAEIAAALEAMGVAVIELDVTDDASVNDGGASTSTSRTTPNGRCPPRRTSA